MTATPTEAQWPALRRAARTVVVVDVVESVRLIEQDEEGTVRRWQRFVGEVVGQLLPKSQGRLVKSLGDGLMVEFQDVHLAIQCAFEMQQAIQRTHAGADEDARLLLRIGVHVADVIIAEDDIYGSGVNLAARLAALAGPGQVVASADVVDQLVDGVDADAEDIGECHFKHVSRPVRCHRLRSIGERGAAVVKLPPPPDLRPSVAVIPFAVSGADAQNALGDAIADDLIAAMSASTQLRVVSRLSTSQFRDGRHGLDVIHKHLGAVYVLSGTCRLVDQRVRVHGELSDARDGQVIWASGLTAALTDLFLGTDAMIPTMLDQVCAAIGERELTRARSLPIPSLDAYSLYVGAVTLLHRLSSIDFASSRDILQHLVERVPRSAAPHAMIAKWHVMRRVQGWTDDPAAEGRLAHKAARRALDIDPHDAFALAVDGLVSAHVGRDLVTAESRYRSAISANPHEPFAWAFLSGLHSYRGDADAAERAAEQAVRLSPVDPARFYFDSYVATARLSAGKYEAAAAAARESLRRNACHTPSYRILAIALALSGRMDDARDAATRLMRLEPGFSLRQYAERYPGAGTEQARRYVDALKAAGVPA